MSEKEFKALIDKYLSGEATEAETLLLNEFIDAQELHELKIDPEHSNEMWAAITSRTGSHRESGRERQSHYRLTFRHVVVACAVVVFVAVSALLVRGVISSALSHESVEWVALTSSRGQKSVITLGDGSRVYLNAESSISYPETFQNNKREVILSGEAFFEVVKDETRPFIVRTDDLITRVLGTSFNIEAFKGDVSKVTVVSGKVQVASRDETEKILVMSDQQVIFDGAPDFVLKEVDVAPYVAWKEGTLYFEDSVLEDVVAELERWYNVKITLHDEGIRHCKINGQYKDIELRSVLKSIEYMYQITFEFQDQNNIVLYGKGCN